MNAYEIREPGYGSGGRSDRAGPDRPLPAGGGGAAGDRSERRVDRTAARARHGAGRQTTRSRTPGTLARGAVLGSGPAGRL